jgi:hypothetical protein
MRKAGGRVDNVNNKMNGKEITVEAGCRRVGGLLKENRR